MKTFYRRPWIGATAFSATAITLLLWHFLSTRPDEKAVLAGEDEVYEAVVRDMVTPLHGPAKISQLVFDDAVIAENGNGQDIKSCK